MRRTLAVVVTASSLAVVGSACGSSGRDMREPTPGATAPARIPNPAGTLEATSTTSAYFGLSSDSWSPGGALPERFTCDGADVSPPLVISSVPPGTVELALVMTDPDANRFVHWVVAGIAPTTTEIVEGTLPAGAVEGSTTNGSTGYYGPCPPKGEEHTYELTLYALGTPSGITRGEAPTQAVDSITAKGSQTAILTGTYKKR